MTVLTAFDPFSLHLGGAAVGQTPLLVNPQITSIKIVTFIDTAFSTDILPLGHSD